MLALPQPGAPAPESDSGNLVWRGIEYRTDWGIAQSDLSVASGAIAIARRHTLLLRPERRQEARILDYLERLAADRKVDVVLLYNQHPWISIRVSRICRRYRLRYVQQFVEWHEARDYLSGALAPNFIRESLHIRIAPLLCDGALVISELLRRQVGKHCKRDPLVIPALISTDDWPENISSKPTSGELVFTYAGAGTSRDLLEVIVEGFGRYICLGGRGKLQLVGLREAPIAKCTKRLGRLCLLNRAEVRGRVEKEEYKELMAGSSAFIWLRRRGRSGRSAFPTRLPEFLITGRPTIISDIGDVGIHLKHRESALLLSSNTAEELCRWLFFLESHEDKARAIGTAGRRVAQEAFSYLSHGEKLLNYLYSVV